MQSPLYFIQEQQRGEHWRTHKLIELYNDVGIELNDDDIALIENEIQGLSTIHRYPFQDHIHSKVHRLFLEAIAWKIAPFEGEAFQQQGAELCYDSDQGGPRLNTQRAAEALSIELGHIISKTIKRLILPLIDRITGNNKGTS